MVKRFTNLVLFTAATLLLVLASARTLEQTLPVHGGTTTPTKADESPIVDAPLDDQKNFFFGGAGGVGGFVGSGGGGNDMTTPLPVGGGAFGGAGGAVGFPGFGSGGYP